MMNHPSGDDRHRFAEVIVDIKGNLNKTFTYRIPEELMGEITPGTAVLVPFGNKQEAVFGYVLETTGETSLDEEKIKPVAGLAKERLDIKSRLIPLAIWMSRHYGSDLRNALMTVMPVKTVMSPILHRFIRLDISFDEAQKLLSEYKKKKRAARIRLLEALLIREEICYEKEKETLLLSPALLKKMEQEGIIRIESRPFTRGMQPLFTDRSHFSLNREQELAFQTFKKDYDGKDFRTYLLFGITGSGKTEVFIKMMEHVILQGRQVIVLIPEISLTYQTLQRLGAVFADRIAILHSKLSKGERHDQMNRAARGEADIIIGPRSALFTPFSDPGLVIIDEEHDGAYKNETLPRYDAREVAMAIGRLHGASVVLASATPSLLSYQRALSGEYKLLKLPHRAVEAASLARTHVVDLREELRAGNRNIFSRRLTEMIRERLDKKEQILLFMNRRGYSNFVSCRRCGNVIKCPHCDVSLTLHSDDSLRCHYCGFHRETPKTCPQCDSSYIAGFGMGTQKLESFTKKMFPEARILRLDTDSGGKKEEGMKILRSFANEEADILIGTQMIVKGHDFPKLTLVGVMAADTSLYTGDYRASQRTFELLTQAAGRAGRGKLAGDAVIQTYVPHHYAVLCAAKQDYALFYEREMAYRRLAKYPPYMHMMTITLSSRKEEELDGVMKLYLEKLHTYEPEEGDRMQIIGPVRPPVYKLRDYYRKLVYIKHREYGILLRIKSELEKFLEEGGNLRLANPVFDFSS